MAAVRSGSLEAVTALVDAGADVNAADPQLGHTVLMWAVRSDSASDRQAAARPWRLARRPVLGSERKPAARPPVRGGGLARRRHRAQRRAAAGRTAADARRNDTAPLCRARRRPEAARVLVEAGANLNAADPNGMTPLMMAITNGQIRVAQLLVDKGADVRAADWYGRTPLWAAVEIRNLDMRSGATDNGIDRDARMRLITSILDKGRDVNARVKEFPPQRRHLLPLASLEWVDFTDRRRSFAPPNRPTCPS
jgi:ankyrin repeat protein